MSRPKYKVVRNRGPVPKKVREPYRMTATWRAITAKDIVRIVQAHEWSDEVGDWVLKPEYR